MEKLQENPRTEGCIKLSAEERYRVRIGGYRILYKIIDREVRIIVVKIAHRKDGYRQDG